MPERERQGNLLAGFGRGPEGFLEAIGASSEAQFPIVPTRESIESIERTLRELPPERRVTFENMHMFCPGIYARTVLMPKDTVLTSHIHKTKHFFVISQGSCTVIDSHGQEQLLVAPYLGITTPGTKRALRIHEDCIWTTFHATTLTDVAAIEREILAESFEAFDQENGV